MDHSYKHLVQMMKHKQQKIEFIVIWIIRQQQSTRHIQSVRARMKTRRHKYRVVKFFYCYYCIFRMELGTIYLVADFIIVYVSKWIELIEREIWPNWLKLFTM